MDLAEKAKQQEQATADSHVQVLNAKATLEELRKLHNMNLGGLRVLRQLAAEQEAEKAKAAREEAGKKKEPAGAARGKAGEKS